jgi:hypothetical protein
VALVAWVAWVAWVLVVFVALGVRCMKQPVLGLAATVAVVALSLGFLTLFDYPTFVGWVAFVLLCLIPPQIVTATIATHPPFAPARQPARGFTLLLVTAIAAAVLTPIVLAMVGASLSEPPGPIPSHFAVIVVPTTFFLAIAFKGWPFTLMRNGGLAGGLVLVAAYVLTWVGFRAFFNYDFLEGTPADLPSAPAGAYDAVWALVFYVTALAGMFLMLHFDLWPLARSPLLMRQPALGAVWTIVAFVVAAVVMQVASGSMQQTPLWVLTRITAPFIFGTIVVLNMLQGSLFGKLKQPVKGVVNTIAAAGVGVMLAQLYGSFSGWWFNRLPMGAPNFEYELWLVNALLSVTFPFLIFHAVYFDYWPLSKTEAPPTEAVHI